MDKGVERVIIIAEGLRHSSLSPVLNVVESEVLIKLGFVTRLPETEEKRG